MIRKIADNIISPLGLTSKENFRAVMAGRSELRTYDHAFGLPEAFCGSMLNRDDISQLYAAKSQGSDGYTFFEQLCILSATKALENTEIDPSDKSVLFVLSTTKGNVEYLSTRLTDKRCYIGDSATRISHHFGNPNMPIVASNACISGVCAQIAAARALLQRRYSCAIVIGCDILSRFIISGFQSFKALSPYACRPYDKDRIGLNLGEAAGTLILTNEDSRESSWEYAGSSIHNDANHISGPSRTGEGSFRVLADIIRDIDINDLGFINAHGTATAYNDEMESIAIHRAGLDHIPVNGLKGYYGHTLGAAGVIETILSMKAIDNNVILPTKGYESTGTTYSLNISNQQRQTERKTFIKILSGFGGSNAGIAWRKGGRK